MPRFKHLRPPAARYHSMLRMLLLLVFSLQTMAFGVPVAAANASTQQLVLAGGCFWGMEGVFESLRGVEKVVSGFAGGAQRTAQYELVSTGATGHAEAVQISYDPSRISLQELLQVYFLVAHDPTQLNRQGPDTGSQYRSAIFYANDGQRRAAVAFISALERTHAFRDRIVTQLVPLRGFYPAEAYHQHYMQQHPYDPYIVFNDRPKLGELRRRFPQLVKTSK